jgi:hypothetical protein
MPVASKMRLCGSCVGKSSRHSPPMSGAPGAHHNANNVGSQSMQGILVNHADANQNIQTGNTHRNQSTTGQKPSVHFSNSTTSSPHTNHTGSPNHVTHGTSSLNHVNRGTPNQLSLHSNNNANQMAQNSYHSPQHEMVSCSNRVHSQHQTMLCSSVVHSSNHQIVSGSNSVYSPLVSSSNGAYSSHHPVSSSNGINSQHHQAVHSSNRFYSPQHQTVQNSNRFYSPQHQAISGLNSIYGPQNVSTHQTVSSNHVTQQANQNSLNNTSPQHIQVTYNDLLLIFSFYSTVFYLTACIKNLYFRSSVQSNGTSCSSRESE